MSDVSGGRVKMIRKRLRSGGTRLEDRPGAKTEAMPETRPGTRPEERSPDEERSPEDRLVAEHFDTPYYLSQVEEDEVVLDPVGHYLATGWKRGLDPRPGFSTSFYLERSPDVVAAGVNPFLHYLQWGRLEGRAARPGEVSTAAPHPEPDPDLRILRSHFDVDHYLQQNPRVGVCHLDPVMHFSAFGWKEGYDPTPHFSTRHYLARNADVRESGINPFLHYLKWGRREGRSGHPDEARRRYRRSATLRYRKELETIFDPEFYRTQVTDLRHNDAEPLLHYTSFGWLQDFDPAPGFSTAFYRATHKGVPLEGGNPLADYLLRGQAEGAIPQPLHAVLRCTDPEARLEQQRKLIAPHFDADFYLEIASDLKFTRTDALDHYLRHGWKEGRDPVPWLSCAFYKQHYPRFARYDIDPLSHYLIWGRAQGLRAHPSEVTRAGGGFRTAGSAVEDRMLVEALQELGGSEVTPARGFDPGGLDIHWVIPDFGIGGGGHMTIFRTIHWLEYFGHRCTIWIKSATPVDTDLAYDRLLKHYQFVKAEIRVLSDALQEVAGDVLIATSWDTAFVVNAAPGFKERFYFVQDYESYFYARGSRSILAEATYGLDLACICASPWLKHVMETRHDRWARHFYLSYDRDFYYPPERLDRGNEVPRIALYSRIGTARRCVELALLALEELARSGVAFHVEIFGTERPLQNLQFSSTFHGVMDSDALGALYRRCDIGLCFSATNYSLVPQEMMACGLPVIELDVESARFSIGAGAARMTPPLPAEIARSIRALLEDPAERLALAQRGMDWAGRFTWEGAARAVEAAFLERLGDRGWTAAPPAAPAIAAAQEIRASVIVPTLNGGALFEDFLDRVAAQKTDFPFELIVIDSGSTDGTVAAARRLPFARVIEIPKAEFQHGRTRNLGAREARGEYLIFATQDALPADGFWIYNFVSAMEAFPEAAGAFGKHYPHTGASAFTRKEIKDHFAGFESVPLLVDKYTDIEKWNARDRGWMQVLHFYSDNNSCMRRSAWEELPYPEVDYGEDQLWAMQAIRRGWSKLYCPNAVVYHSHDYDYAETLERAEVEAWFFHRHFGYDLSVGNIDAAKAERDAATETLAALWRLPAAEVARRKRNTTAQLLGWELGRRRSEMEADARSGGVRARG